LKRIYMKRTSIVTILMLLIVSVSQGLAFSAPVAQSRGGWGALESKLNLTPSEQKQYEVVVNKAKQKALKIESNRHLSHAQKQSGFVALRMSTFAQVRLILTSRQQVLLNKAIASR
jgi:hypothetical protein